MIPIPACVLVTSPVDGRVHLLAEDGVHVAAGDTVAEVERDGDTFALVAPRAGRVGGALALAHQPVGAGDGVMWLDRA